MNRLFVFMLAAAVSIPVAATAQSYPAPSGTPQPVSSPGTTGPDGIAIPTPLPPLQKREVFVEGGYVVPAVLCNELSPCNKGNRFRNTLVRAGAEFPVGRSMTGYLKADLRSFQYPVAAGTYAAPGAGLGNTYPSFQAHERESDIRAGIRALEPRLYLGVSHLWRTSNYGYPNLSGFGAGLEKLPDVDQTFSLYGSAFYYPRLHGTYTTSFGSYDLSYHTLRYDIGATIKPSTDSPFFLDAAFIGSRDRNAANAPANATRNGPYLGIGLTLPQ